MQNGKMKRTRAIGILMAVLLLVSALAGVSAAGAEDKDAAWRDAYYARLDHCVEEIRAKTDFVPEIVIVLGTGLGDYVYNLDVKQVISYGEIDGWPVSTAPTHAGRLVLAEYKGLKLAVMQGRIHYYEGYSMEEVVLPLRVLYKLGARTVLITSAVGSLNPDFLVGGFVAASDLITCFVPSPLLGQNLDDLGPRFTGMTNLLDKALREETMRIGEENDIPVYSGIYLQMPGPQYETPAEVRLLRMLGADVVGMSVGAEAIAARHMGMRIFVMNCIANMGAGMEIDDFDEESIGENMLKMTENFTTLMNGLLDFLVQEKQGTRP